MTFRIRKLFLSGLLSDVLTRSFTTGCIGHNAFHGRRWCSQVEKKVDYETVYSDTEGNNFKFTDEMFRNRIYSERYLSMHKNKIYLEEININMVSQFPLNPMHLIDLGVTKKIFNAI